MITVSRYDSNKKNIEIPIILREWLTFSLLLPIFFSLLAFISTKKKKQKKYIVKSKFTVSVHNRGEGERGREKLNMKNFSIFFSFDIHWLQFIIQMINNLQHPLWIRISLLVLKTVPRVYVLLCLSIPTVTKSHEGSNQYLDSLDDVFAYQRW